MPLYSAGAGAGASAITGSIIQLMRNKQKSTTNLNKVPK